MFEPFPFFVNHIDDSNDGVLIKRPLFYQQHSYNKNERNFFNEVRKIPGWHVSPSGFSCFVDESGIVFFGIRVANMFDRKKSKDKLVKDDFNPVLSEEIFLHILNKSIEARALHDDVELNNQTIHEIRKLNATVKSSAEYAISSLPEKNSSSNSLDNITDNLKRIFSSSSLITIRLNIIDFKQNPGLLSSKTDVGVHKKFLKAARCIDLRNRNISVGLEGNSTKVISCYSSFEILPVVLLENAVKYSADYQKVQVIFSEQDGVLEVSIISVGPLLLDNEKEKIFENKFRGLNAKLSKIEGSGIGLNVAKLICDQHNIEISAQSDAGKQFDYNGIKYAPFIVKLKFK